MPIRDKKLSPICIYTKACGCPKRLAEGNRFHPETAKAKWINHDLLGCGHMALEKTFISFASRTFRTALPSLARKTHFHILHRCSKRVLSHLG
jgi:hypothetical protein